MQCTYRYCSNDPSLSSLPVTRLSSVPFPSVLSEFHNLSETSVSACLLACKHSSQPYNCFYPEHEMSLPSPMTDYCSEDRCRRKSLWCNRTIWIVRNARMKWVFAKTIRQYLANMVRIVYNLMYRLHLCKGFSQWAITLHLHSPQTVICKVYLKAIKGYVSVHEYYRVLRSRHTPKNRILSVLLGNLIWRFSSLRKIRKFHMNAYKRANYARGKLYHWGSCLLYSIFIAPLKFCLKVYSVCVCVLKFTLLTCSGISVRLRKRRLQENDRMCKLYAGGASKQIHVTELAPFVISGEVVIGNDAFYKFKSMIEMDQPVTSGNIACCIPLSRLAKLTPRSKSTRILHLHSIPCRPYLSLDDLIRLRIEPHCCETSKCKVLYSVFELIAPGRRRTANGQERWRLDPVHEFPCSPLTTDIKQSIMRQACTDFVPDNFEEAGCSVCGQLTLVKQLKSLRMVKDNVGILSVDGVQRLPRSTDSDPLSYSSKPILCGTDQRGCPSCIRSLADGKLPKNSLASGLWLGDVPEVLKQLTFAEKLLVSRIQRNVCVARIASGGRKLVAKAVMFTNPLPKIYSVLPPPLADFDEMLALIFTGPVKPTEDDLKRTPFLVCRTAVGNALWWLKLNHIDYLDVDVNENNLNQYPKSDIPVSIKYRHHESNLFGESMSIHISSNEDGTDTGNCPFAVHGLTVDNTQTMRLDQLKQLAIEHLDSGGKVMAVGHGDEMVSIFNNPQLYPMMFPWLFPFGSGGLGTASIGYENQLKHLLMYHDKQFQTDNHFVLIAFHHLQVRKASFASFLACDKASFPEMTNRLLDLDIGSMRTLMNKLDKGSVITSELTDAEQQCFRLLHDLDVIGTHVDGSVTLRKFMRAEIWLLIIYLGAPMWYITLSPADINHPLCIYFAGTDVAYRPDFSQRADAIAKVISNPVAGARFFDYMVRAFIKHILGVGSNYPGLFGDTEAYYGTVEQQGRLTLHLHLLLWIKKAMSLSDIRAKIMEQDSAFFAAISAYMSDCHQGEFINATMQEVDEAIKASKQNPNYIPPTYTMPTSPPLPCQIECGSCVECESLRTWQQQFVNETNDLLF